MAFEPKNYLIIAVIIAWAVNSRRFENWLPHLGILLILALITEVLGKTFANSATTNCLYYNLFIAVDFVMFSLILAKINPKKIESNWIFGISSLILVIPIVLFLKGKSIMNEFAMPVLLIMGTLLVIHSTVVILRQAQFSNASLLRSPGFWVSLSPFFYFACVVPSLGLVMYFVNKNKELASKLYEINDYLFVLRYLLILVGLILALKKQAYAK